MSLAQCQGGSPGETSSSNPGFQGGIINNAERQRKKSRARVGSHRVFQLGVRGGMDSYKKDKRGRDSMTARKIRKGGILVAKARRKSGFDRIFISGMENKE